MDTGAPAMRSKHLKVLALALALGTASSYVAA